MEPRGGAIISGAADSMPQHSRSAGAQGSLGFANTGAHVRGSVAAPESTIERTSRTAEASAVNARGREIAQIRQSIGASPRLLSQRLQLEHSFGYPQRGTSIASRVVGAFAGPLQRLTPVQAAPGKEAAGKLVVEDGG